MRINNGFFGCPLRQVPEQLHQACLVRIAHRGFTICLNPIRMLDAQVVVNLLLQLIVGVDLMMRGRCSGETSVGDTRWSIQPGLFVSAPGSETNEFHKRLSVSRLIAPNPRGTKNHLRELLPTVPHFRCLKAPGRSGDRAKRCLSEG